MNPIEARRRAEKSFKHAEHSPDRQSTMPGYEVEAAAVRAKTAQLKALRMGKEGGGIPTDRPVPGSVPPNRAK